MGKNVLDVKKNICEAVNMPENKKKEYKEFLVGEIPTQTEPTIYRVSDKEQYTLHTALCQIMNDIAEIKKAIK